MLGEDAAPIRNQRFGFVLEYLLQIRRERRDLCFAPQQRLDGEDVVRQREVVDHRVQLEVDHAFGGIVDRVDGVLRERGVHFAEIDRHRKRAERLRHADVDGAALHAQAQPFHVFGNLHRFVHRLDLAEPRPAPGQAGDAFLIQRREELLADRSVDDAERGRGVLEHERQREHLHLRQDRLDEHAGLDREIDRPRRQSLDRLDFFGELRVRIDLDPSRPFERRATDSDKRVAARYQIVVELPVVDRRSVNESAAEAARVPASVAAEPSANCLRDGRYRTFRCSPRPAPGRASPAASLPGGRVKPCHGLEGPLKRSQFQREDFATMDLTKTYPRSVKDKHLGMVQIARTIDKGKAVAFGNVGEYNYDCPMDKHLFEFLGIDGNALLEAIKKGDAAADAYLQPFIAKKGAAEIEKFNKEWLEYGPEAGSDGEKYFLNLRNQVAPDRTDVKAWADLLDLDEKRPVPQRAHA